MNLHPARPAALSGALVAAPAACKPSGDAGAAAADAGTAAAPASPQAATATLSGAGSSFIYPLLSKWSADCHAASRARINYQSIGSGGGSADSFAAAVTTADWGNNRDFDLMPINAPDEQAWPITTITYVLMHRHPGNSRRSADMPVFFKWAFENGRAQAKALDYVPLPAELVIRVETHDLQGPVTPTPLPARGPGAAVAPFPPEPDFLRP